MPPTWIQMEMLKFKTNKDNDDNNATLGYRALISRQAHMSFLPC